MSGRALWINADAGEPEYNARQLRRAVGGLLAPGGPHRLGARQGVRPGTPVVELSGSTVIVHPHQGVIDPALTSSQGAYPYEEEGDSFSLSPADGSSDRTDIVVERIYDHDEDASGQRKVEPDYIVGTPGGGTPSTPSGAMLLASILVPSGGSPSPTLTYEAPSTTALGGIIPVRDSGELPTAGLYDGMAAWLQDTHQLSVYNGDTWIPVNGPVAVAEVVSGTEAELTLTIPDIGLRTVRIVGVARCDNDTFERRSLHVGLNNRNAANAFRVMRIVWSGDTSTPALSFDVAPDHFNCGSIVATESTTDEWGDVEIVLPNIAAGLHRNRYRFEGGLLPLGGQADLARHVSGSGRVSGISDRIHTVTFTASAGDFVAGTYFELYPA